MNKGFYMAALAVLAASMSKKSENKQKKMGSLSIEDLNALSSAEKRRGRWRDEDPLSLIRDIFIEISTDKPHFTTYQVEKATKTIQRLVGLSKFTIVIRKNFPIRILDGLITPQPNLANWYIPIRHLKELDITVFTVSDMRDDFFNESSSLSKIRLKLNSNKIPESLFRIHKLQELKFEFYERNRNSNLIFPENYSLNSLKKLELFVDDGIYNWRTVHTENLFRIPSYISKSKNLKELSLSKIATCPEIKKLRNLEKLSLSDVLIEPHMLEIRAKSIDIKGTIIGKLSTRVNNKAEFLDLTIKTSENTLDLSFLSKMKNLKEASFYIIWDTDNIDEKRDIIMPKNIKALSHLKSLIINSSTYGFTEKPALILSKDFSSLASLKYLNIRNAKVELPSIGIPSLEKINLYNCVLSNINMSGYSSLKEINIEGPWRDQNPKLITITNSSFSGLSKLSKLKIKNVYLNQIPNISGLTNLTNVIIQGRFINTRIPIIERDITSLTKLKRMTLELKRANNTDPLHNLPKFVTILPNLEYLNLKSSEISDLIGIDKLKKIKGIKSSIPTLKRIRKRPDNYTIVEMTRNGLSEPDAIKIMKYSSTTPISQIRRF